MRLPYYLHLHQKPRPDAAPQHEAGPSDWAIFWCFGAFWTAFLALAVLVAQ